MKLQPTDVVLITGATGGLGTHIARAFAKRGKRLALAAYPGNELEELREEIAKAGVDCVVYVSDLRQPEQQRILIDDVLKDFGRVDVLVNNAGIEFTSFYHELSEGKIMDVLKVNLEAPMMLTRLLLPQMLERHRGHVVNISSLAGKSGPAFQEPYSAAKAALVAFTYSLRSTYRAYGVSSSVVVPGFVEAGIYTTLKHSAGCSAPVWLGTSRPEIVAEAAVRTMERDAPEIIINRFPVRPLLALAALFPRPGEWLVGKLGADRFFQKVVEAAKHTPK
jgi:short-subunit dehydrogenase